MYDSAHSKVLKWADDGKPPSRREKACVLARKRNDHFKELLGGDEHVPVHGHDYNNGGTVSAFASELIWVKNPNDGTQAIQSTRSKPYRSVPPDELVQMCIAARYQALAIRRRWSFLSDRDE